MGTSDQSPNSGPGRTSAPGKATPADARPRNRTLLLQALHADGPQSRADLARMSGLTPTTVSAVTADTVVGVSPLIRARSARLCGPSACSACKRSVRLRGRASAGVALPGADVRPGPELGD